MRILLVLFLASPVLATDPATLAQQLGDRDFHVREAAGKQLDTLGEPALPVLKAVIATGTPEAVRRAQAIHTRITARVESDKALAPRLVTLDFTNAEFKTIAAEILKQTGTQLKSHDPAVLTETFTIRVKDRPFWEVVDALQRQLGLAVVEAKDVAARNVVDKIEELERKAAQEKANHRLLTERAAVAPRGRREEAEQRLSGWEAASWGAAQALSRFQSAEAELEHIRGLWELRERSPAEGTLGTVILSEKGRRPACVSGAVRVEGKPFDGSLTLVSPSLIPLVLDVQSEPGKLWGSAQDVVVTKATSGDGIDLVADTICHIPRYEMFSVGCGIGQTRTDDPRAATYQPKGKGLAFLFAPPGKPVTKLAVVEGVIRGELWSGGRRVPVEVPFKLTDVPVAAGTRSPSGLVPAPGYNFNVAR